MSAIVPPADTPLLFQPDAREVFQRRAYRTGKDKNQHRMTPQSVKKQDQEHTAYAVDRQIWTSVDASVDKGVVSDQI